MDFKPTMGEGWGFRPRDKRRNGEKYKLIFFPVLYHQTHNKRVNAMVWNVRRSWINQFYHRREDAARAAKFIAVSNEWDYIGGLAPGIRVDHTIKNGGSYDKPPGSDDKPRDNPLT